MPSKTLQIRIERGGRMRFIYDDALAQLCDAGNSTITRASHVEPDSDGTWFADMSPVNGPVLRGYKLRQDALDAEIDWLRRAGY